ncbi:hypothetical protein [Sulfurimonas sp.]|uniref:hypothetical protein n=1 Tax=Sulfurimonas sp. TaxID=2022749 RepID=UPI001A0E88F3|nr:hypothetical protein [Sulfurimonas sp.]MBE0514005.1 hypothetical protein [Sulfurimonas sp.]MDT8339044.1 hypothetical protein [Sulfurimonas sp.]
MLKLFSDTYEIAKSRLLHLLFLKPCHCNLFFKRKIRLVLLLNHFIPRCPYYTTYFAFRRTGVHPPL